MGRIFCYNVSEPYDYDVRLSELNEVLARGEIY